LCGLIGCLYAGHSQSIPKKHKPSIEKMLLCLASLSHHHDYLLDRLPSTHPLRVNYLFCNPNAQSTLKMQLARGDDTQMRATGIPPHVELYRQQQKIQKAVEQMPSLLMGGF
jgi:hypothetical protein